MAEYKHNRLLFLSNPLVDPNNITNNANFRIIDGTEDQGAEGEDKPGN